MSDDRREAIGRLHELGARFVAQKNKRAIETDWNGRKGREKPTLEESLAMDRPGIVPGSLNSVVIDVDLPGYHREIRELFEGQYYHAQESSESSDKWHFWFRLPVDPATGNVPEIKGGKLFLSGVEAGDIRATWGMVRVRDYEALAEQYDEWYESVEPINLETLDKCRPPASAPPAMRRPKPTRGKYSPKQVESVVKNFAADRDMKPDNDGWRLGTRGSVSVSHEGDYFDHEHERGGGLGDFVKDTLGCSLGEALNKIDSLLGLNILSLPTAGPPPTPIDATTASKDQYTRDWQAWLDAPTKGVTLPPMREVNWLPEVPVDWSMVDRIEAGENTMIFDDDDAIGYLRGLAIREGVQFHASAMEVSGDEVTTVQPRWWGWRKIGTKWQSATKEEVAIDIMKKLKGHLYKQNARGDDIKDQARNGKIAYGRQLAAMILGLWPWRIPSAAWDRPALHVAHKDGSVTELENGGTRREQTAENMLRACSNITPCETSEIRKDGPIMRWAEENFPDPYIRECFWYHLSLVLIGYQFLDRVILIEGEGGIGKTSFGETLELALGSYARTLPDEAVTTGGDAFRGHSAKAHLESVRAGIVKDLKKSALYLDTGLLNNMVGNRVASVRDVKGREANIELCVTPIIIGNRIPGPKEPDSAIRRRVIKFNLAGKPAGNEEASKMRTEMMAPESQAELMRILVDHAIPVLERDKLPPVHPDVLSWTEAWLMSGDDISRTLYKFAEKDAAGGVTLEELQGWLTDELEVEYDLRGLGKKVQALGLPTGRKVVNGRDLTIILGWKAR